MQKEFNKMAPSPELKTSGDTKTHAENNIDSGAQREPANLQRTTSNLKVHFFFCFFLNFVLSSLPFITIKSK